MLHFTVVAPKNHIIQSHILQQNWQVQRPSVTRGREEVQDHILSYIQCYCMPSKVKRKWQMHGEPF